VRGLRGLYVVVGLIMAGVGSVFALLAELEHRYDLPAASLGWIAGSSFVAALVTQLTLARYADRGYATLLLRAGVAAGAAGLLWFAAATELWQFVAARMLLGAGVGLIMPPARRAIVLTSSGNQGERLGVLYAAYLSGFVFGPPVAGVLTTIADVRLPFLVLGLAVCACLVPVGRIEMPPAIRAGPDGVETAADRRVLRRLLGRRRVIAALLVIVSFRYSVGVFEPLWAAFLDDLGASTLVITLSLTAFALPMLLVARQAGRLSDRYGPRVASVLSAFGTIPLMGAYGFVHSVAAVTIMVIPHGLLEAIQSPGTQAALSDASPTEDAAAAQGLGEAAGSAAAAIGAFTAAPIFASLGAGPAWLIAAIVMACLLTTSTLLDRPRRRTPPSPEITPAELEPPAPLPIPD
jgi:MFS transporter, DHA1 family, multidrug resistance protein